MTVRGRNLISGLPEEVEISSIEMREALAPSLKIISQALRDVLEQAPPEIMADLLDSGLCLTGGGALLQRPSGKTQRGIQDPGMAGRRSADLRRPRRGRRACRASTSTANSSPLPTGITAAEGNPPSPR